MSKLKFNEELASFGNPDMHGIMNNVVRELQAKKEQVIKDKFTEKGFAHLLVDIEKRRFKKVLVEKSDDCEKWYADDGTNEGILIVTFLNPDTQFTNNIDIEFTMTTGIKYY